MANLDNQYYRQRCPAMMGDGRIYTSYVSNQVLMDAMKRAFGIDTCAYDNNDTRYFLQHNADLIMRKEREYLLNNYQCRLPKRPIRVELPFER